MQKTKLEEYSKKELEMHLNAISKCILLMRRALTILDEDIKLIASGGTPPEAGAPLRLNMPASKIEVK